MSDHPTRKLSWAERLLTLLAGAVFRRPGWFLWPQVALAVVCVVYTIEKLEFHTDRNDLVGAEKQYHKIFLEFRKEFTQQDNLVVVAESEAPEKNRQFVERLGVRLEAETNLFTGVFYKRDLRVLGNKTLLFAPIEELRELRAALREYGPFIETFASVTNLNSLLRQVNAQFLAARDNTEAQNQQLTKALPALEKILGQAADAIQRTGPPPPPGFAALLGNPEAVQELHITFASGRIYLVAALAVNADLNEAAVRRLRELVEITKSEVPGVSVGVTGEPVLEIDEMAQVQVDTTLATIVSLLITALIFIYGYHETGRPLKAVGSLLIGLAYTMGFTTLAVGHLNLLTITFAPILIGLAIDFGVHLVTRYEEELRNGKSELRSLELAMVNTGLGIFTGCLTTACAFLAMALTDFRGIQEMGIITGGGLIICLVPMMTALPALLLRGRQNALDHAAPPVTASIHTGRRARLERYWLDRPWTVLGSTVALCVLCAPQFWKVHFDYNLLNMQSANLPAVQTERQLIQSATNSVLFAAVVADTPQQAFALEEKLRKLPAVADVKSLTEFLAENPGRKLNLIHEIKAVAAAIRFAPVDPTPVDVEELSRTLYSFQGYVGAAIGEVKKVGDPALLKELQSLWHTIDRLRMPLLATRPVAATQVAAFQRALLEDIQSTFAVLRDQHDRGGLRPEEFPAALRERFIGRTGRHLLQVYPKGDVWQRGPQREFVGQVRSLAPEATGTPVQLYEYTELLKTSYIKAAWYALGAIALMAFIHFRSVSCVILSLLPVALGAAWMIGVMGVCNVAFNPANIMTLPLVIGVGVTNGIHILNRFAEEQNPSILAKSTGKAVIVSALTTVAGFGSLMLAQHQGIASLGFIMAVGTATCMLAGLTSLPAMLTLLTQWGWKIKRVGSQAAPPD